MDDPTRTDVHDHEQPHGRDEKREPAARRRREPKHDGREAKNDRRAREAKNDRRDRQVRDIPWCRLVNEKGRKYTPWILLRFNDTDMGLRPIPANTPFWFSPDIWVESSDPLGRAVAGEPNYLHARVINLGKAPAYPTRVQFYWGDPSLGLGGSTMNLIGTEWAYVPAHASLDVRCNTPWVPVMVNAGHECLIVNTSSPMLDPITNPFQPKLDRHVGQRNITVIPASAGQLISMKLAVNNLFPMMARMQFMARVHHLAVDERALRYLKGGEIINQLASFGHGRTNTPQELLARYTPGTAEARLAATVAPAIARIKPDDRTFIRPVDRGARSAAYVSAKLSERGTRVAEGETMGAAGRLLAAVDTLRPAEAPKGLLLEAAELQPNEQRSLQIDLRVPQNAARGEFVVMHVVQHMEQVPVGGYTIVAAVESR